MSWKEFEESAPEMASLGSERINRKITYLATIKKNSSPRLHPVTPFIGNGMLFMFTEPTSPKIGDLCRDGRYAMHCSVDRKEGDPLIEFLVSGNAQAITDELVRQEAKKIAATSINLDGYYLFEFHIDYALAVEYDDDWKKVPRRWRRDSQP
ncbi:MAG: hypothetical protein ISR58_04855 [Anaerolineales bacterium]|nr:hypothetical protein [Chloroflexota bacterium]MBL6980501.1 hypothetical protein [Anaerolineales bacterium]